MSPCVGAVCAKMSASSFILLIMFSSCHWLWTSTKDGSEEVSHWSGYLSSRTCWLEMAGKANVLLITLTMACLVQTSEFGPVQKLQVWNLLQVLHQAAKLIHGSVWFCLVLFGCHSFFSFSGGIDFCTTLSHNCSMKTKLTGSTPLLTGKLELLLINPQILTFSSCCFGPTSSPNLQDASFTLISDKENTYTSLSHQQVLLFTPVMSCCDTMSAVKSVFVSSSGAGSFSVAIATY